MSKDMEKYVALWWAAIWGLVGLLSVVAMFWNPAQIGSVIICGVMCGLFIYDYLKGKKLNP